MAHLTKPTVYTIEDSNIALLGSELEKRVHEHAGDKERAWEHAGLSPGLQIWRIEKFTVVDWPKDRYGSFYDGDSYIVLHTYKQDPKADALSYDLHFWLGSETTQDEAGTAAYKTVELDDHLQGLPVQHREIQGYESPRFLSHFPRFVALHGGVATGFHHVSAPPPPGVPRLFRIGVAHDPAHPTKATLLVREVPAAARSLAEGDVFVLDKGTEVWQLNTKASVGKEKFRAAEFVQSLVNDREGRCEATVYEEGGVGAGRFLDVLGVDALPARAPLAAASAKGRVSLFRLSDATGVVTFDPVEPFSRASLSSDDAFLLDHSVGGVHPALYVWIGRNASLKERRLAGQYAQSHLYEKRERGESSNVATTIVKMNEGSESHEFLILFDNVQ
ncbi:fragmin60 [Artomyces pyxidatus]|uniref:Fragmin60 n=1 Tax=Artomyces pyxidatus TaxID=48021 RepID=A0ACB8ST69_9AGAM|nr:fragmin60 [Artomyces pyxidatus]